MWLIYALGGGWGHLNRALALGQFAALHHPIKLLVNSPYADRVGTLPHNLELVVVSPSSSPEDVQARLQQLLQQQPCDRFIVDTFPRGLGGELAAILPRLKCPRVLIHRDLHPAYVQRFQIEAFVQQHFEQVIIPGEGMRVPLAHLPQTVHTQPWLSRNPEDLADRPTARTRLNLDATTCTVLILASGQQEELAWYGQVSAVIAHLPGIQVCCLAATCPPHCPPELWRLHYPALEVLLAADLVVGSGGYNTVYECCALGIPLVAKPWPRLYDRQAHRLQQAQTQQPLTIVNTPQAAIIAVENGLQQNPPDSLPKVPYSNGAIAAVHWLESLCSFPYSSIHALEFPPNSLQ
jgi:hypothetical protein